MKDFTPSHFKLTYLAVFKIWWSPRQAIWSKTRNQKCDWLYLDSHLGSWPQVKASPITNKFPVKVYSPKTSDKQSGVLWLIQKIQDVVIVLEKVLEQVSLESIKISYFLHRPVFLLWKVGIPLNQGWAKHTCKSSIWLIFQIFQIQQQNKKQGGKGSVEQHKHI